ncbi:polysaccharide deacetylase family protein [Compostibacter hankyongensis]|uniref:Polysaccharide deacetylase family protein n=1 Tax=Compostibacter hankyongensis TaxID=1007089 RepID=A0ABP8FTV2_9BACT
MSYFVKTPGLLRALYKSCVWRFRPAAPTVYLTFDDGPHPKATPFVLEQLRKYKALATFFCIGKNVAAYPDVYQQIFIDGHAVGNHTHNHLNGWKTGTRKYVENVRLAEQYIDSRLFRPPYGKITPFQIRELKNPTAPAGDSISDSGGGATGSGEATAPPGILPASASVQGFRIIMWDVLSGDFDTDLDPKDCLQNVLFRAESGSIIVFHDSEKAWERLEYALPRVLEHFSRNGFRMAAIPQENGE